MKLHYLARLVAILLPLTASAAPQGAVLGTLSHARAASSINGVQAEAASYRGQWEPISNAMHGMGKLDIGPSRLHWGKCAANYMGHSSAPHAGVDLALDARSRCRLDDVAHTRIRFIHVEPGTQRCDLAVRAYATRADLMKDQPAATGTYTRARCNGT